MDTNHKRGIEPLRSRGETREPPSGFVQYILHGLRVGENIELLAALLVALLAITMTILHVFGVELLHNHLETTVNAATLVVLATLALSFLVLRFHLSQRRPSLSSPNSVEFLQVKPEDLIQALESSSEIDLVGLGLRATIHENYYTFKERVRTGGTLRVLIVDVDRVDIDVVAQRFSRGSGRAEHFRKDFENTLRQLSELKQEAGNRGSVEVRLLSFVPSYSLYHFPNARTDGHCFVEIYNYKSSNGTVPKFRLTERGNSFWYQHFRQQFELMWADALKINLE